MFGGAQWCISQYYEIEACVLTGYQYFGDWQELTPEQQSTLIAFSLVKKMIESHQSDAERAYIERRQRRSKK